MSSKSSFPMAKWSNHWTHNYESLHFALGYHDQSGCPAHPWASRLSWSSMSKFGIAATWRNGSPVKATNNPPMGHFDSNNMWMPLVVLFCRLRTWPFCRKETWTERNGIWVDQGWSDGQITWWLGAHIVTGEAEVCRLCLGMCRRCDTNANQNAMDEAIISFWARRMEKKKTTMAW